MVELKSHTEILYSDLLTAFSLFTSLALHHLLFKAAEAMSHSSVNQSGFSNLVSKSQFGPVKRNHSSC